MTQHLALVGAHRVIVKGLAMRFFVQVDGAWSPTTDLDFQHAYELSLFDPDALAKDVLCPNARRVEYTTDEAWFWSDGCGASGMCTFDDKEPAECSVMALLAGAAS
ncbi:hypothetical protein [Streptomyces sp. NPDC057702]|uniref:hypothetical protein n=1 Tax=unclassified Streptomyces TaxID=2593676 RepID=UPI003689B1CA